MVLYSDPSGLYLEGGTSAALQWVTSVGTNGQVIQTDGSSKLSFAQLANTAYSIRTVTASTTVTASDWIILCNHTAAITITLPQISTLTTVSNKLRISIKDISGAAVTNNVTIVTSGSDLIENASSLIMNVNFVAFTLLSGGTNKWWIH